MATKFPKHRPKNTQPIDLDAVNENFLKIIEEEGEYNEQNWERGAIKSRLKLDPGALFRQLNPNQSVDPGIGQGNPPPVSVPADGFQLPVNSDWTLIDDLIISDKYFTGSFIKICGSWQQESSDPVDPTVRYGIQYAVRLDGAILPETVPGGADRSNDKTGEGYNAAGMNSPIVIEAVVAIETGNHTIEIVARTIRNADYDVPPSDDYYMILNRELSVLELY